MLSFREYLDYATKHLRIAEQDTLKGADCSWLLIPATILAWSAIESFVNNRLDDYSSLPDNVFQLHEKALLLEKRIQFWDSGDKIGTFELKGTDYKKLEDKIFFLIAKFSSSPDKNIKGNSLWNDFEEFKNTRDRFMHPRKGSEIYIDVPTVQKYIQTSKDIIQLISTHIWDKTVEF